MTGGSDGAAERVRLVDLRAADCRPEEVHAILADERAGGVVVFVGAVRDRDDGRAVVALEYSAHPQAPARLVEVATDVARRHDVLGVAAVHRVGELRVGDVAVVVGACAEHRSEAFSACRALIDELKASVPIWKCQRFADGSQEWVGSP